MSVDKRSDISEYIYNTKYAQTVNGKKETWKEAVSRVMMMHYNHYIDIIPKENTEKFNELLQEVWDAYNNKNILGAQRALQFGGGSIEKHNTKIYNCSYLYMDKIKSFKFVMYLLLSGCGVGYSVQKRHISYLPTVKGCSISTFYFVVEDSIEGWAEAVYQLIKSYFDKTEKPIFDYSKIREEGAYITGGFKAPGYKPLKKCLDSISIILDSVKNRKLTSFEIHRICCLIADSVISGGIRRSAMICLFDATDEQMFKCKSSSDWFDVYPELCRCNNSVVILPNTPKDVYERVFSYVKSYGEPGFVFLKNQDILLNPCAEVAGIPIIEYKDESDNIVRETGVGFCNLCEINGAKSISEDIFYRQCRTASILGTFQAGYTNFKVLGDITKQIAERDSLIGVGITGMFSNPQILFDENVLKKGAEIVKETNTEVAKILGINPASRTTVIKPSGNSSQLLGCSSGIHPYRFRKFIRHIQANNNEDGFKAILDKSPQQIEKSFYSPDRESVLAYPIEIKDNEISQDDISTKDFLEKIKLVQQSWIEYGTNFETESQKANPNVRMNVSNTVTVKDDEWDFVKDYLWENRDFFSGVSLIPNSGDLAYPQAPYTKYMDASELISEYKDGAILSSGLIVDGIGIFGDINTAICAGMGERNELLQYSFDKVASFIDKNTINGKFLVDINGVMVSDVNAIIAYIKNDIKSKNHWVDRFKRFSENYFNSDNARCGECLKRVNIFHKWQKIKDVKPIDWSSVSWTEVLEDAGSQVGTACSGGKCEI